MKSARLFAILPISIVIIFWFSPATFAATESAGTHRCTWFSGQGCVPWYFQCGGGFGFDQKACNKLNESDCKEVEEGKVDPISCISGGSGQPGGSSQPTGVFLIKNPLKAGTIPEILDAVAKFLFNIALAFVTIMVLWGGFQILTAAGRPEQIDKGKRTLLWAVIGTVVILIAGGIADLTANILGGKSSSSSQTQVSGSIGCNFIASSQGSICQPSGSKCPSGYKAQSALQCEKYNNDPAGCRSHKVQCVK